MLAAPAFVKAQAETFREAAVSEASCCCCSPEKVHSETGSCRCDGCAQKNSQNCACVRTAPSLAALLADFSPDFLLFLCGGVVPQSTHLVMRTDPPRLRPPIIS